MHSAILSEAFHVQELCVYDPMPARARTEATVTIFTQKIILLRALYMQIHCKASKLTGLLSLSIHLITGSI